MHSWQYIYLNPRERQRLTCHRVLSVPSSFSQNGCTCPTLYLSRFVFPHLHRLRHAASSCVVAFLSIVAAADTRITFSLSLSLMRQNPQSGLRKHRHRLIPDHFSEAHHYPWTHTECTRPQHDRSLITGPAVERQAQSEEAPLPVEAENPHRRLDDREKNTIHSEAKKKKDTQKSGDAFI